MIARTLESGNPLSIGDSNGRPLRMRNSAKSGPIVARLGDLADPVTRKVLNPYFDITAFRSLPTLLEMNCELFTATSNPKSAPPPCER